MSKTKLSLKEEHRLLTEQVKQQQDIINHLQSLVYPDYSQLIEWRFEEPSEEEFITLFKKFHQSYFVTLIYDPQYISFTNDNKAVSYYLNIIHHVISEEEIGLSKSIILGSAEHTKNGQVHVHFCIKFYAEQDIKRFMFHIKPLLTHRLHLNVATDVKKTNDKALNYMLKEKFNLFSLGCHEVTVNSSQLISQTY